MSFTPLSWEGSHLALIDQRLLPGREVWLKLNSLEDAVTAIKEMAVRGAPAIGITAAYGMALAVREGVSRDEASARLRASRPTAVNLFWAVDRISSRVEWTFEEVVAEAKRIQAEDLECNLKIGRNGLELLHSGARILTICNTGSLATAGHGTALGMIRTAHASLGGIFVYSCETRPRMQGLRLTAWELQRDGIPFKSIADSAAGALMRQKKVDCVIAGADRIAANGDTANKIGTYSLAVLAAFHGIPFYVAAPSSTIDASLDDGDKIPIEERDGKELTEIDGVRVAPEGCPVHNPAFDVTPGKLICAIVTENGVHRQPYEFQP